MNAVQVKVIDGELPADCFELARMEPKLSMSESECAVFNELLKREPLFHRAEFGIARPDFEKMTEPAFWEVGASGRRYSREFILDTLELRYRVPTTEIWELSDGHCAEIAEDNYLFTYTLRQAERITRRSTIWRRTEDGWKIVFHQGTPVT